MHDGHRSANRVLCCHHRALRLVSPTSHLATPPRTLRTVLLNVSRQCSTSGTRTIEYPVVFAITAVNSVFAYVHLSYPPTPPAPMNSAPRASHSTTQANALVNRARSMNRANSFDKAMPERNTMVARSSQRIGRTVQVCMACHHPYGVDA